MDIKELKNSILNKQTIKLPLILKYTDNKYIANQYADAIINTSGLIKVQINSLKEISNDNFFDEEPQFIYFYDIDKLEEYVEPEMDNIIVICKDLPSDLKVDYVEIPKLLNWQIEDFVKVNLPGLSEDQTKWLCDISKYNVDRLSNECKKLSIFPKASQKIIFDEMNMDNAYSDLNSMNIFNFTDAIINRDYALVGELIPEIVTCDLEPLGVVTILLKKFLQIVNLQMNPKATAASLGMSDKQFNYLKMHPNKKFTEAQLIRNIEFLTEIDYKVKTGLLEFSANTPQNREELLAYFVTNVLC